jgi:large subunit ribosomal protein L6
VEIPDGVTVDVGPGRVSVNGPKGELNQTVSPEMEVKLEDGTLTVARPTDRGHHRALHGLTRSLIANMVEGVTEGYSKQLEIQGVGYRARLQGKSLELSVGYSHTVSMPAPDGIDFEVPQPTQVIVSGIDKQLVGETAARIRRVRPPEPYKGKGIRYAGEHVRRKVGKRA